ncbi:hypothetical protein [Thiomicrospira sp.]|uniref:hypothetical protein n=1 Tax=Thiomicrospira sp. TaxID=935 RepID=UPI002F92EC02
MSNLALLLRKQKRLLTIASKTDSENPRFVSRLNNCCWIDQEVNSYQSMMSMDAKKAALDLVFSSYPENGNPYQDFMSASSDGWQVEGFRPHSMFQDFDVDTQKLVLERAFTSIERFALIQLGGH